MIPVHWLHIYNKPKIGTDFLTRYPASNYKHRIVNNGGFDTMSCDLHVSRVEANMIFSMFIGNKVSVVVDNPAEPIWEGLISRITLQLSGLKSTISLDDMANRVETIWREGDYLGGAQQANVETTSDDTDSQAIYGIKETVLSAGYERSTGANATRPASLQSLYLSTHSFPIVSTSIGGGGGNSIISIEAIGLYQTLGWERYPTGGGVADPGTHIAGILSALSNGATFFDNSDTTALVTNTSFNSAIDGKTGQTYLDALRQIVEPGDGAARYIFGLEREGLSIRCYYRAATSDILYTTYMEDGLRIRDVTGARVAPWKVRPDGIFRVLDVAIGDWTISQYINSPNEFYIASVSYDANAQTVDLQGDDNITVEGIYQFGSYAKPINRRFGWKVADAVVY